MQNFRRCGSYEPRLALKRTEENKPPGVAMGQQNPPDVALVLIVDDDEGVLRVTADILEALGYHVLTAGTGPEAVELLRRNPEISVLFTDIRMPDMRGEELAEIAVAMRPGIRVVFTSGFPRPPGDAAFVPRPYRAVDLIDVLPPQPLPSSRS